MVSLHGEIEGQESTAFTFEPFSKGTKYHLMIASRALCFQHFPKATLPDTVALRITFQHKFWRGHHYSNNSRKHNYDTE